jgi:uncharacterized membrane protein YidH (DUF202 family)
VQLAESSHAYFLIGLLDLERKCSESRDSMKPVAIVGVLLIVFGLVALAYQGLTYTRREKVIDLGPVRATAERQITVPLPPVVGIAAVAAGVALLVADARKGS